MGRLKGSKNKAKTPMQKNRRRVREEQEAVKRDFGPGPEAYQPPVSDEKVVPRGTPEGKKKPLMSSDVVTCLTCGHLREMHYGGAKEWCNTKNCGCQAWAQ